MRKSISMMKSGQADLTKGKRCKDCQAEGITSKRKAPYPGPRCATHYRLIRKERSDRNHARHIGNVYGITADEYQALKEYQGGLCAICRRADGSTRRLSVDHDHSTGRIRSLLCRPCNDMLGHLRDDPAAFRRAADYLVDPPALKVLGERLVPFDDDE